MGTYQGTVSGGFMLGVECWLGGKGTLVHIVHEILRCLKKKLLNKENKKRKPEKKSKELMSER